MIIYETRPAQRPDMWDKISIREMAATMQDMDAASDPVTIDNLKLRGYSSNDIELYGLRAAKLARKLSVKVVMS